jgi:hypothetical protein
MRSRTTAAARAPVVVDEVGELLPQTAGRDALVPVEAVDQPDRASLGGKSTSRCTWLASSLNPTSFGLEVRADGPHDLLQPAQLPVAEHAVGTS